MLIEDENEDDCPEFDETMRLGRITPVQKCAACVLWEIMITTTILP
jgi:hypothetical protein